MRLHRLADVIDMSEGKSTQEDCYNFVTSAYFSMFVEAETCPIELNEHVLFMSPFPSDILPEEDVREHIYGFVDTHGMGLVEAAVAYAAMIDYFALCIRYPDPKIGWRLTRWMDDHWHVVLESRSYVRLCGWMAKVLANAPSMLTSIEAIVRHIPDSESGHVVSAEEFNNQIKLMRTLEFGVGDLANYMAKGVAADCQGGCNGVWQAPRRLLPAPGLRSLEVS